MEVFLIKTISIDSYDDELGIQWGCQNDGLFFSVETAAQVIENNWGDISECGTNEYAAIIRTTGGLYPIVQEMGWYWWNSQTKSYQSCDRPEFMDGWSLTL